MAPVHRPGAFPLRPLTLGDIFDGAFRIIRYNPGATVGAAVFVAALAMALPVILTTVLTFGGWADLSSYGGGTFSDDLAGDGPASDGVAVAVVLGTLALGTGVQSVGLLFVTGMGARVTAAAALGRKLRLGEAWAETRGTRWRLIGLSLVLALFGTLACAVYLVPLVLLAVFVDSLVVALLFGILGGIALMGFLVWAWIRFAYLSTPALVLERHGIRSALSRSRTLTRGSFWRVFGIGLLTTVVAVVAAQVASIPMSLLAAFVPVVVGDQYALLASVLGQAATGVLSAAFATPFLAVVAALQYHDQRIRKEALDVVLMEHAGLTGARAR